MAPQNGNTDTQMDNMERALSRVNAEAHKFKSGDSDARAKLVAHARELIAAVETPMEAQESVLWTIWANPLRTIATRVAVELKIFETAVGDGGRPKTADELAVPTGASPKLVNRIARICAWMGTLSEEGPRLYAPVALTHTLTQAESVGGIVFSFDANQPSYAKLPEYLKSIQYQNPENPADGPFQHGHNLDKGTHIFQWLADRPDTFQAFHQYIHGVRAHRPQWYAMYPVKERLVQGLKPDGDGSAFVDVGGSTGQILIDLLETVPEYSGRLVLQERSDVIEAAKSLGLNSRIELQAHDFFSEQPVKGARAYFMRSILHDWPDKSARSILLRLKEVMVPGYSKILISDCVVKDQQAEWQHLALDMHMMALASSQERTESEWHELITSCGLRIVRIYSKGQGNESLIEVEI